jgi:hypothetical protein
MGYFASLPFLLVAGASPGAHRSWAISFIGLAVTLPAVWLPSNPAAEGRRRVTVAANTYGALLASAALSVALVGDYSASSNAYERFPGPFVLNTDGRNVTSDMIRSAQWFAASEGRGQSILTTSRTFAVFGAYAGAQQRPFPAWEIFFPLVRPEKRYVDLMREKGFRYIVTDDRMTTELPHGRYFNLAEPNPPAWPLPAACLTKFDSLKWLSKIHQDGHITIYRLN